MFQYGYLANDTSYTPPTISTRTKQQPCSIITNSAQSSLQRQGSDESKSLFSPDKLLNFPFEKSRDQPCAFPASVLRWRTRGSDSALHPPYHLGTSRSAETHLWRHILLGRRPMWQRRWIGKRAGMKNGVLRKGPVMQINMSPSLSSSSSSNVFQLFSVTCGNTRTEPTADSRILLQDRLTLRYTLFCSPYSNFIPVTMQCSPPPPILVLCNTDHFS